MRWRGRVKRERNERIARTDGRTDLDDGHDGVRVVALDVDVRCDAVVDTAVGRRRALAVSPAATTAAARRRRRRLTPLTLTLTLPLLLLLWARRRR